MVLRDARQVKSSALMMNIYTDSSALAWCQRQYKLPLHISIAGRGGAAGLQSSQVALRRVQRVAHSLNPHLGNFSRQSAHQSGSINKRWLCPLGLARLRGRWGYGPRGGCAAKKPGNGAVFFDSHMGAFLNGANGWKNKSCECPAYFIIRRHSEAHLHKQRAHCSLL